MPAVDITVVLYGLDGVEWSQTLCALAECKGEFRRLSLLISAPSVVAARAVSVVRDAGLADVTTVEHRYDNLGFAAGHNRLLRAAFHAGADYVLILNPDVSVSPGALHTLVAEAERDGVALFGPTLRRRDPDGRPSGTVDTLGVGWNRWARHFDIGHGEPWRDRGRHDDQVLGVSGACLLVSKAAFRILVAATGEFFDESFLAYREDAELGVRARAVGLTSVIVPSDGFTHTRSVRGYVRDKPLPDLLGVRNRFLLRWKLGSWRPGCWPLAALRDALVVVAVVIVERSSIPGLRSAFAIRRYEKNKRRNWKIGSRGESLGSSLDRG